VRDQKDGRDLTAAYAFSIVGGAAGGQVANFASAMQQAANGEFAKASMTALPKFAVGLLRAEEYQRVGTKDSRGNTILDPEEISAAESAIAALGLTPTRMSRTQDKRQAFFEARQNRADARSALLKDYARAKIKGEDLGDIEERIAAYNSRNEDKINAGTKAIAVSKQKDQTKNLRAGVPVKKSERQLYEEVLGSDDDED
jgi:hypothetical protein